MHSSEKITQVESIYRGVYDEPFILERIIMTHVLVTGGAGFIGSHLVAALLQRGYKVRVLDNLSSGKKHWIPKAAEFIEGDITELKHCHEVMQDIQGVFHCAALSRVSLSFTNIDLCTATNITGTQNILIAARDAKVKKIIYSGSSTFYGNSFPPHVENASPSKPLNFYSLTKQTGEQYCLLFDELFNLPCIVLRYFNVYGPRQPEEGSYALVLGTFLRRWANNAPLEIHGDGNQRRDFIHVNDVVEANIAAFESSVRHEVLNVGSGKNISIKELAELISPHHIHVDKRLGDADCTLADITRIQDLLNWQPHVRLIDGIAELKHQLQQTESMN